MAAGEPGVSLLRLRAALRARVERTSLRAVARDVGITHRGLSKILGGTRPQLQTRRKLDVWYTETFSRDEDPLEVSEALEVLLCGLPGEKRAVAYERTLAFLRGLYRELGGNLPEGTE